MARLLLFAVALLVFVPAAQAKGPFQVCGASGCVELAPETQPWPVRQSLAPGTATLRAATPASYYMIRWAKARSVSGCPRPERCCSTSPGSPPLDGAADGGLNAAHCARHTRHQGHRPWQRSSRPHCLVQFLPATTAITDQPSSGGPRTRKRAQAPPASIARRASCRAAARASRTQLRTTRRRRSGSACAPCGSSPAPRAG